MVVVLPEPFDPTKPVILPSPMLKLRSCNTCLSPKLRLMFSKVIMSQRYAETGASGSVLRVNSNFYLRGRPAVGRRLCS